MKTICIVFIAHLVAVLADTNGKMALLDAIRRGDESMVRSLVEDSTDVNNGYFEYEPPLILAIMTGRAEMVKLLIELGANPNIKSRRGYSPLHLAVDKGNEEVIKALIQGGTSMETTGTFGMPILMEAITKGRVNIVELLIEHGADFNEKWKLITPLRAAILRGRTSIVKLLVEKKVNVNQPISFGIDYGLAGQQWFSGETPLMCAVKKNHKEIVELLLKNGADVNATDYRGRTAKDFVRRGHYDIENLLIKYEHSEQQSSYDDENEITVIDFNVMMNISDNIRALRSSVQIQIPHINLSDFKVCLQDLICFDHLDESHTLADVFPEFEGSSVQVNVVIWIGEERIKIIRIFEPLEEITRATKNE